MDALLRWTLAAGAAVCSLLSAAPASAQGVFPPPETYPDLRLEVAGTVNAIAKYNDGAADWYLIGGDFDLVNGVPRSNLARVAANGTLDAAWQADADGIVHALAIAGDRVFVGGQFTAVDGATRLRLAQLDADDGALSTWAPDANNTVFALQTDGTSVWAGGLFTNVEGAGRALVARIDAASGMTTAFNATVGGNAVYALLLDGSDLYIGGQGRLKGSQRALIKVAAASGAPIAWNPGIGPQGGSRVRVLAADGSSIYAAGRIRRVSNAGNFSRGNGARFQKSDAALLAWNPAADAEVLALAVDGTAVFAAGDFLNLGGHVRLAKTDAASGAALGGWTADADRRVAALLLDGAQLLAGGSFADLSGSGAQGGLARMATADATLDAGFMADAAGPGTVSAFAFDAAGGVVVGGSFDAVRQDSEPTLHPRRNVVRLLPTGGIEAQYELDTAWSANAAGEVFAVAIDGNDLFLGGNFAQVNGSARTRLAKLAADTGVLDAAWLATADAPVRLLATDAANSRLYVVGDFINLNATSRAGLGRVSTAGAGTLESWNPAPDDVVDTVLVSADGVYAGGSFATIGGAARARLARLDATTASADPAYIADADAAGSVHALAEEAGALYVGGQFSALGGSARNGLARTDGNGVVDASWNPDVAGGDVRAIAIDALAGQVYFGGAFSSAGGLTRWNLARASRAAAGAVDATWRPGTDGTVVQMTVPEAGQIFFGGAFTRVTGEMRNGLALLGVQGSDVTQTTITSITPVGGTAGTDSLFGQGYVVAWSVTDVTDPLATPTGVVTVTASSGESCGPVPVATGSCTLNPTATGARNVTASFVGDALFLDSSSAASPHTVDPAAVALTVATTPLPSSLVQSVDANITLVVQAPGGGAPQGTVAVTVDGAAGCTITLPATTCSLGVFPGYGFYDIEATYTDSNAPANHVAAASATSQHAVGTITSIDLSLPANATVGTPVQATIATTNLPDATEVVVTGGSGCTISVSGNAGSCMLTFAASGNPTVTASFAGNADLLPSQDQASLAVAPITTTLSVALLPAAPVVGQAVQVNLTTNLPDGATVSIAGAPGCTQIVLPATSCATGYAAAGAVTVDAGFAGNAQYSAATASTNATVGAAPTAFSAFNATSTIATAGETVAFTWTLVAAAPGSGTPTGNVRVSVEGNGTAPSCVAAVASGTCSMPFPAEGTFNMRAEYLGDGNFAPVLSGGVSVSIVAGAPVEADLQIAKIVSRSRRDPANQIEQVEYQIVVVNAGPAAVTGATITDVLPASLSAAVWLCAPDDGGASCGAAGGTGNVGVTANLAVGSSVTVTLQADVVNPPFPGVQNSASVAAPLGLADPVPANNSDTVLYQACLGNTGATLQPHLCMFRNGFEAPP
jgi:hypothetical protein